MSSAASVVRHVVGDLASLRRGRLLGTHQEAGLLHRERLGESDTVLPGPPVHPEKGHRVASTSWASRLSSMRR